MIDLYYWTTPNCHKITIALEELDLPYRIVPVNIGKGEQLASDFLRIAPNNRVPAIVDQAPLSGGAPVPIFESGAILVYLAEKAGKLLPSSPEARAEILPWVFWQVGGLGPMCGQIAHFGFYAAEKIPYAIDRYQREVERLFGVLNRRLAGRDFLAGDAYSIADIINYPYILSAAFVQQDITAFPDLKRWADAIGERPATKRAYELIAQVNPGPPTPLTDKEREILFGQNAATIDLIQRSALPG